MSDGEERLPAAVRRVAGNDPVTEVWVNELGGRTFEIGRPPEHRFLKWNPAESGIGLDDEAARMEWARRFTPAPEVVGHGTDDEGEWLITLPLRGDNAIAEPWRSDPKRAVTAVGKGLRHLHDVLPVASCPFDWDVERRLQRVTHLAEYADPSQWREEHRNIMLDEALDRLAELPSVDRLVVCHGDACAPNTLIGRDGKWSGHVDFGALGVADRWADIAAATWSVGWNYGMGWETTLLDAYGIAPDPERSAYYRLLWDLE